MTIPYNDVSKQKPNATLKSPIRQNFEHESAEPMQGTQKNNTQVRQSTAPRKTTEIQNISYKAMPKVRLARAPMSRHRSAHGADTQVSRSHAWKRSEMTNRQACTHTHAQTHVTCTFAWKQQRAFTCTHGTRHLQADMCTTNTDNSSTSAQQHQQQ